MGRPRAALLNRFNFVDTGSELISNTADMASSSTPSTTNAPRLKRVLSLWDLVFYGIVLIQPIAPVPLYGVAQKLSDGHFVTIILIVLFGMLITAVSYGRMGALYPQAGSAYTYVGKGLNPHL